MHTSLSYIQQLHNKLLSASTPPPPPFPAHHPIPPPKKGHESALFLSITATNQPESLDQASCLLGGWPAGHKADPRSIHLCIKSRTGTLRRRGRVFFLNAPSKSLSLFLFLSLSLCLSLSSLSSLSLPPPNLM